MSVCSNFMFMMYEDHEIWVYDLCSETNIMRIFIGNKIFSTAWEGLVIEKKIKGWDLYRL